LGSGRAPPSGSCDPADDNKAPQANFVQGTPHVKICKSYYTVLDQFLDVLVTHDKSQWLYGGQTNDWPLATSLERVLGKWDIDIQNGPEIERLIIRDFKRRHGGQDHTIIRDTLYCLTVLQHHGAPTRLLDWTYSPYVAAKFAIEDGGKKAVIWCLNSG
jgi:hypothetical protein